jgi:hypothetical protein
MTPIDNEIAPPGGGRKARYPWASWKIGDRNSFPIDSRNSILSSVKFYRLKHDAKFRIITRRSNDFFIEVTRVPFNYQPRKAKKR